MADRQGITPAFTDSGLSRLYRSHAVEQHAIQSEIRALVIIAGYVTCPSFSCHRDLEPSLVD